MDGTLDACTGKRNLAFHSLHSKFIDSDVIATLPPTWLSSRAKEKVDEKAGEGVYESMNFNPNNHERIAIDWKNSEIKVILGSGLTAYSKVMNVYTLGT